MTVPAGTASGPVPVSWPQQATDELRFPPVCVATGAAADAVLDVPVRRSRVPAGSA